MRLIAAAIVVCSLSGCFDWSNLFKQTGNGAPPPAAAPVEGQPAAPAAPGAQAAVAVVKPGIPDVPAKIVDKKQALAERPHLVETANRVTASDPISAAAQGYFAAASRAEMLAFMHNIRIHQATYDKYPTFEEFMEYYRQSNAQLKGLKPWQVYAYDESDGTITLLEDREEKKRQYEEAGMEYRE